MNELYVPEGYLYFKTQTDNVAVAVDKLIKLCAANGIELTVEKAYLRNEDGEDIDETE